MNKSCNKTDFKLKKPELPDREHQETDPYEVCIL